MTVKRLYLERIYADKRIPAFHLNRDSDGFIYDANGSKTFIAPEHFIGDPIVPMERRTGLYAGMSTYELVCDDFQDGFYHIFYHDLGTDDKGVFMSECFEVAEGQVEPFKMPTMDDQSAEFLRLLLQLNYQFDLIIG